MPIDTSLRPLRLGLSLSALALLFVAACAPTAPGPGLDGDGVGSGGGGSQPDGGGGGGEGDGDGDWDIKPPTTVSPNCGNGVLDGDEQCDDGNEDSLDGCNNACQQSPDFDCPTAGQLCVSNVACGDGRQHNTEACDEGAESDGVGCAADCLSVDVGWQCRVPGRACIPLCGDSLLTAGENCDDGNFESGDGCSSNCLVEPGYSCGADGLGPCVASICGNGDIEVGESCDEGEANGLFFGDGSGCSKTCTNEPICRDANGVTQACSTACGDGNVDTGEACDDGNAVANDGCSDSCTLEDGFVCPTAEKADTAECPEGAGQCLILPITYRDFDPTHPDFYFLGEGGVMCVPNASGNKDTTAPDDCWDGDSTDLCQGLAAQVLGPDGKPTLGTNTTCECRFTDWDSDLLVDAGAEYSQCFSGDASPIRIETVVDIADSEASFLEWYHDSESSEKYVSTIVLEPSGNGQYRFSSSDGDTIADDIAGGGPLTSGFFPLDSENGTGSSQLCNMWPYWDNGKIDFPGCSGPQWNPDANDGNGGMEEFDGEEHNFYFTSEVRYLFKYVGGEKLEFFGDDDVFVYINGQLTLDLGAPHERLRGNVVLSDTNAVSTVEKADGDDEITQTPMDLVAGNIYEIAIFHADRHPRESNYQLTLQGFSTTQSECIPECGDGVATTGEECDDGTGVNDDNLYGGCTTQCKYGPYCGDEIVNGEEQCDLGLANNASYGDEGCTSACTVPSRCGDAVIDTGFGEQCDDGENNGVGLCDEQCILHVIVK